MKRGKHICETLKAIRKDIAAANDIDYNPTPCHHEGDCEGTCPKCENEMRWLEKQLRARQALGKAVTIAGLSVALGAAAASCGPLTTRSGDMERQPQPLAGDVPSATTTDTIEQLAGDVMCVPDSIKEIKSFTPPATKTKKQR